MCVYKGKHTCDHAPLGGQKRVGHLPFSQVWRPLSVRTASPWGWLWCFTKQIFQPTRAQGVESWCMKFKFCLMLRETAVTSNSVGETGVMNFRQAVSGVWHGASKVIFKDNSDELFSPFILILEPNCTTCSDTGLLFYLSAFNLHHRYVSTASG